MTATREEAIQAMEGFVTLAERAVRKAKDGTLCSVSNRDFIELRILLDAGNFDDAIAKVKQMESNLLKEVKSGQ